MTTFRLRCSYGGRIIPGSHGKSSYYFEGVTRIVHTERLSSLSDLRTLLSQTLFSGAHPDGCCLSIKYQLPGEDDLDRLISVTTDQDLRKMYQADSEVQLFLFLEDEDEDDDMDMLMRKIRMGLMRKIRMGLMRKIRMGLMRRRMMMVEDEDMRMRTRRMMMHGDENYDIDGIMELKELKRGSMEGELGLRLPSSSSSPFGRRHPRKYDVFLSFRGKDTRSNFVSHLYDALDRNGIVTFRDDKSLEKGKSISPELVNAIEDSKVALVILSPNYASSTWCLDELLKIMECRQVMGQLVIPVFYHLQPSVIRKNFIKPKKKVKYMQTFTEHEEVYLDNADKVKEWSAALTNLANLSGFVLQPGMDETHVIKSIVRSTAKHTLCTSSKVDKGFVGMDSRVDDLLQNYIHGLVMRYVL